MIEGIEGPAAAWRRGVELSGRGDLAGGVMWLERAVRLAPGDPRILLDLANVRVALGGAEQWGLAGAAFSEIIAKWDVLPAWLGLVTVRRLMSDHTSAAEALLGILRRFYMPGEAGFAQVASVVAAAAGFDGWSGVLANGEVVSVAGGALGPPFDWEALWRVEGVVSAVDGSLVGWASQPAAPDMAPVLKLVDADGVEAAVRMGRLLPADEMAPLMQRYSFVVPGRMLGELRGPVRVVSVAGRALFGSPIDAAAQAGAMPVAAAAVGEKVWDLPRRSGVSVVMPIYGGFEETRIAVEAVLAALPAGWELMVVDDASPEVAMAGWLDQLSRAGRLRLVRMDGNVGFPAAVNAGVAACEGRDILLLNSDTIVPAGAMPALVEAAYAKAEVGTATPFSNEATILSYPVMAGGNVMPDGAATAAVQLAAAVANGRMVVEIPVGVGFCLFVRRDCWEAVGGFRAALFAQGYGEEVDFCLRARQAGYRHVAAVGAYVAHRGGVSFKAAGRGLNARNAAILARLYPGYDELIAGFIKVDPLAGARRRVDEARFAARRVKAGAVLLISHDHGGGVARIVKAEMTAVRAAGMRALLLSPGLPDNPKDTPFPWMSELTDGEPGDYPNLRFLLPGGLAELLGMLRAEGVRRVVFHHGLGHHPSVRQIAGALGVKQEFVIHDYASFCPRINLLTRPGMGDTLRYCGEPAVAGCEACVEMLGDETYEGIAPTALLARSSREFSEASRVVAPSADTARRIARHFPGVRPEVVAWEDDSMTVSAPPAMHSPPPAGGVARRIVVVGGIGTAKGYDVLLECARDAARRNLKLEFFVAGTSADDAPLLETGRIFVTGAYKEGEAETLIKSLKGDLAFFPSIWPETWCFALSEAWRAGLYAIGFDLGAQGARIKATGRGAVLPLGLPVPRINDTLANWRP